ncbi:MAG: hypothetical protein OXI87_15860 [Albidovulum sp.]|nr:hypothetical protein [Albidovulum sp.]MDE0306332.1 hypothetical protein [Albidovulum sp.]
MTRGTAYHMSNGRIALTVEPDFGARITSLSDIATGRQWLVEGQLEGDKGSDAIYAAAEARGWDECFPTVSICEHPDWCGSMRDHGELWGRPWTVRRTGNRLYASYKGEFFEFQRTLELRGSAVHAKYRVANIGATPFKYMWSQHCLLAVEPGEKLVASDSVSELRSSGGYHLGSPVGPSSVDWPFFLPFDLDLRVVHNCGAGLALKLYGSAAASTTVGIDSANGGIRFSWYGIELSGVGIWLNYGGWPPDNPVHHVAIEPTTVAVDHLEIADALGKARKLDPMDAHNWEVRISMVEPEMNGKNR